MSEHQRILVIKLGALGDVVLALGPMAAIRRHHPDAHITVLTTAPYVELLSRSPYVDEVWTDARPRFWQIGALRRLRRRLRDAGFARVYDLQTSDRSTFYFHLLGVGPEWSGIAPGCSHPHANPGRDRMHTIDRQAEQLAVAGIASVPAPDLSWLTADLRRFALASPFALLVPGGAATRPRKRWPVERFAALAASLVSRGFQPVILGTAPEQKLADAILAACPAARSLVGADELRRDRHAGAAGTSRGGQRHGTDASDRRRRLPVGRAVLRRFRPGPLRAARAGERAAPARSPRAGARRGDRRAPRLSSPRLAAPNRVLSPD